MATRVTWQRQAIQAALGEVDAFQSAQELHHRMRQQGSRVGLSTVYRALQSLADAGEADLTQLPTGETLYRRCGPEHHHHLVCRSCGTAVEIQGPTLEKWVTRTGEQHGFTQLDHTVEIHGLCPQCGI